MASRAYGQQPFSITSTIYDGPLSNTDITREIDAGRPIIAGISPGQQTPRGYVDHVVLIVGYEQGTNADLFVIVNDPFPFDIVGMPNPYVSAGATSPNRYQYRIESHKFAQVMNWTESASNIQRGPATSGAISVWEIAMLLVSWLFIFMSRNSKWAFLQKLN